MSIDRQDCSQDMPNGEDGDQPKCPEDTGGQLMQLLEELDDIDETSKDAALNKHNISDNNGGRIELTKQWDQHYEHCSPDKQRLSSVGQKLNSESALELLNHTKSRPSEADFNCDR